MGVLCTLLVETTLFGSIMMQDPIGHRLPYITIKHKSTKLGARLNLIDLNVMKCSFNKHSQYDTVLHTHYYPFENDGALILLAACSI